MIDLRELRDNPDRFREGAQAKRVEVDIDRLVALDADKRRLQGRQEEARAEQKRLGRETGPQMGKLKGELAQASEADRPSLESQIAELEKRPAALKQEIQGLDAQISAIEPELRTLILAVPQPAAPEVPVGAGAEDNVEIRRWHPADGLDPERPFAEQSGFAPKTHL